MTYSSTSLQNVYFQLALNQLQCARRVTWYTGLHNNSSRDTYYISIVTTEEKQNAIDSFAGRSWMPNVLGAIDGTNIGIKTPKEIK